MDVSLPPELEHYVSLKLESGRYGSASEVIGEALRLLEEHDPERAAAGAGVNQELARRLASLDRGEWVDPAAAREKLEAKSRAWRQRLG